MIVALADEDDCSAADLSMFLPAAFYRALLDDPRMQEEIDPQSAEVAGAGHLQPVCESETARAYPARRLVELARRFGENGTVQSICQPDFADVMRSVLERVAHRMRNPGNADSR